MRTLKMLIAESISLEGKKFLCQVVGEIRSPQGDAGLVVEIAPPIPFPDEIREKVYEKDLRRLFTTGVNKAILFPKWQEVSLSPRLNQNPTMVYVFIPAGRNDWGWGKLHVSDWALVMDDGPRTSDIEFCWD